MYKLYKITNTINDFIYFGYTSQTLAKRFSGHKSESRDTIISHSIRKYGKKHFIIEGVCETESEFWAKNIERSLILKFQTNRCTHPDGIGMNMTDGGEGAAGYLHTEKQKAKWKKERKGMNAGKQHPRYGKPSPNRKPVYGFKLDGTFVGEYETAGVAGKKFGVHGSNITKVCRGISKTCASHYFSYIKEFVDTRVDKIIQLSIDGVELARYKTIKEAVTAVNGSNRSSIDYCLMGNTKTAFGFKWKRV